MEEKQEEIQKGQKEQQDVAAAEDARAADATAGEDDTDDRDPITVAKESFYDRLPFTYRQVDIFCKVLIGVLIAIFAYYAIFR